MESRPSLREQMAALYETWHAIYGLFQQIIHAEGLSDSGFMVLDTICQRPENCTQKFICEQTLLPKQAVNAVIKRFLAQGYLEMEEVAEDRRNKAIRLTASGQAYAEKVMARLTAADEHAMGQLDFEQRQMLLEISKTIERGLRESL